MTGREAHHLARRTYKRARMKEAPPDPGPAISRQRRGPVRCGGSPCRRRSRATRGPSHLRGHQQQRRHPGCPAVALGGRRLLLSWIAGASISWIKHPPCADLPCARTHKRRPCVKALQSGDDRDRQHRAGPRIVLAVRALFCLASARGPRWVHSPPRSLHRRWGRSRGPPPVPWTRSELPCQSRTAPGWMTR